MMKHPSKKVFGLIVTIVIAIFVVAIVIVHQKHLQENKQKETKGVLYGVDVTDLSSHGVKNLDTDNDSKIYEKKLSDKEVDISSLGSEPYIEAIYHIQKLYQKDDIESLYNMINWEQMDQDGMGNVTEETFSRYLKDSFGNRNEARIFPLQTYKDKKAGYSIVGLCAAAEKSGSEGNVLYDYDSSSTVRFTIWNKGNDFAFVPYSVIEGPAIELLQLQNKNVKVMDSEQTASEKIDDEEALENTEGTEVFN